MSPDMSYDVSLPITVKFLIFGCCCMHSELYTVIPRFMSLICSAKTAHKVKTLKTKINFPLLPSGNNDRFVRGRSSYKQKLAHKLKNRY
jgi:hypothetical protein